MGVLGLGLLVSALEEKFGWDAFRVGSDLMVRCRVCWWYVTCTLETTSGWIGNQFEKLTDDANTIKSGDWTVVIGWETMGLLWFYGVMIIWSFIVTTIFYYDRKSRLNKGVNHSPIVGTNLTDLIIII
ncbi:hypothetical protein REPUB_Repub03eG0128700 [Reevesia pubescens]